MSTPLPSQADQVPTVYARNEAVRLLFIRRANELADTTILTNTRLVELQAVLYLLNHGELNYAHVKALTRTMYNLHESVVLEPDDDFSGPAAQCVSEVWGHIRTLISDGTVSTAVDADSDVDEAAQNEARQWAKDVMAKLQVLLSRDDLYPKDVADLLPQNVNFYIHLDFARANFGSPYTLGASLHHMPTTTGNGQVYGDKNGLALLRVLVENTHAAITAYHDAPPDSQSFRHMHLELNWMILKGFVYSLVNSGVQFTLNGSLHRHPELIEDIALALEAGFSLLTDYPGETSSRWGHNGDTLFDAIVDTATPELVEQLRTVTKEAGAWLSDLRSVR